VLLTYKKVPKVNCKVAKFIRLPKVSPEDAYKTTPVEFYKFYNIYLYRLYLKKYSTIFYINNNAIYFYNNKNTYVSRMIPIYNYKNGKIKIISAGRKQSNIVWGSWRCVKAPNGNLYGVYVKELEHYRTELVVHNLSKDRVINNVEYDYAELLNVLQVRRYVHILLNSFIVIFKIKDNVFNLYLFDLINETMDTFIYTTYDYMRDILKLLTLEDEKKHIRDILSRYFAREPAWNTSGWDESINCTVNLLGGEIPFVKYIEAILDIGFHEAHEGIDNALFVAFKYEDNTLEVSFSTGQDVVIIKNPTKDSVSPPPNSVLFSKKYELDISYDISKSYPYYIYKVSKNYIFGTDVVFEKTISNESDYTIMSSRPQLISIKDMAILLSENGIFANLDKHNRNKDLNIELYDIYGHYVVPQEESIKFLDLAKIYKNLYNLKNEECYDYDDFINASDFLITFDVKSKIEDILYKIYQDNYNTEIKLHKHYYYLDETNSNLYLSVIVAKNDNLEDNAKFDFYVFEYNIRKKGLPCRIVMYSVGYDSKTLHKKSTDYVSAMRMFAYAAGNKIQFFEILTRINDEDQMRRIYIYNNEIMLINDIFVIKAKDIRYNRSAIFNCGSTNTKDIYHNNYCQVFDYNVVSFVNIFTDKSGEDKRRRYMIILSSLEIIISMPLSM
jgi:hypothetical protein